MDEKLKSYVTVDTLGKSKVELVIKVYDGAISSMRAAINHFGDDKYQLGVDALEKAKKFLVHLYTTLDDEKGGDIAKKLGELYAFIIEQINFAQATRDLSRLEDSIKILNNIREGWAELAERAKNDKNAYDKNPHDKHPTSNLKISI